MGNRIFCEAPVNEFGFVGFDDSGRHVGFVQLMKREAYFTAWLHSAEQKAVNVRGSGFGVHFFWRQRVADCSGGADDPAGEDAAVFAPVRRVENAAIK